MVLRTFDPSPVARLRLSVFDQYLELAPRQPSPSYPVRIVDIDEASLAKIGQWPWPRTRLADIVSRLQTAGASVIAFDLILSEPDRLSPEALAQQFGTVPELSTLAATLKALPANDTRFAAAIASAPVVLGFAGEPRGREPARASRASFAAAGDDPLKFAPRFPGAVNPLPPLADKASGLGAVNWLPERDQIVRRVPLVFNIAGTLQPSLSLEAMRVAEGTSTVVLKSSGGSGLSAFGEETGIEIVRAGKAVMPTDAAGELWLNLTRSDPKRYIPAHKVLDGSIAPDEIKGRIVFIGASAAGLLDLRATPLETSVPGVEIHAQAVEQMISGEHLLRPAYATGAELLFLVASGLGLLWLMRRAGPGRAALGAAAAIAGVVLFSWSAYRGAGLLFDPVYPALVLATLYLATSLVTYIITEAERARVRAAFGHYIPPAIVDGIVNDPARLNLGGETRQVTVLFADVRGFSRISEGLSAAELIEFVNTLFSPLTGIIYEEGGTVDKYMGDAVMAFWNAPLDVPHHAAQASRAALRMQAALNGINATLAAEARARGATPVAARLGVGINTGPCVVGNVGSQLRKNYSILGDTVNVAARLEEATKTYGVPIIAGEHTALQSPHLAWIEIDRVPPRGKDRPERLYALLGDESVRLNPGFSELSEIHAALAEALALKEAGTAAQKLKEARALAWPGHDGLIAALEKRAGVTS